MKTNILWTGREYYSMENCLVQTSETGSDISSVIVGTYDKTIYRIDYLIRTNSNWETVYFEIKTLLNGQEQSFKFDGDGKGGWTANGKEESSFQDCIDIDIPLTPLTNTLPIRRLNLTIGEERQIQVIYLDLLKGQFIPVQQKYVRLSETDYYYENIPNDFEAEIAVDAQGLVVDYPSLFVRTASVDVD